MRLHHLVLLVAACGGSSSKKPDAAPPADASPDAYVCNPASVTAGTPMAGQSQDPTTFLRWGGTVTGMAADGMALSFQDQFYTGFQGAPPTLAGTFDLGMGDQNNFATCALCFLAFEADAQGNITKTFFQSAGSITLTEDPFDRRRMVGTVSNLAMVEVTIDQTTFASTPVPGGECLSFGNETLNADQVPAAWTCTHDKYLDKATCDCSCGVQDPDCDNHTLPNNCTPTTDTCFAGACVVPPVNDTCTTSILLTVGGAAVSGTTAGANGDYAAGLDAMTCTGVPQPGYDVAYRVALIAGMTYTFTLTNTDMNFDPSISLVGPAADASACSANITTCVAGADTNFGGMGETLTYAVPAGGTGTYYVIIDSFDPEGGGAFTIAVQ